MFGRVSTAGAKRKGRVVEDDDGDEEEIENTTSKRNKSTDKDELEISDDDLAEDLLTARSRKPPPPKAPPKRKPGRPVSLMEASPVAISDDEENTAPDAMSLDEDLRISVPSQSSDIPTIPRALLLRLMHEHFASKETKIDKHALVVLEKYFEVYIRETIARSLLAKKEDVEKGAASQSEERWLEKSDLENIVAGVVMDF
jgi:histone H3/H4